MIAPLILAGFGALLLFLAQFVKGDETPAFVATMGLGCICGGVVMTVALAVTGGL
jgi:hypothetical protein